MLKAIAEDDSQELFELVDRERERLGRWLSWVSSYRSVEDVRERRRINISKRTEGSLFDYAISIPGSEGTRTIIGACGAFSFSDDGLSCELGYWISEAHEGRGLTSEAIAGLQDACFRQGVEEVRISCVPENKRSAAIPRKLGYHLKKHSDTDLIFVLRAKAS
jgi:ribosomal-protein-serine acetyltransferase